MHPLLFTKSALDHHVLTLLAQFEEDDPFEIQLDQSIFNIDRKGKYNVLKKLFKMKILHKSDFEDFIMEEGPDIHPSGQSECYQHMSEMGKIEEVQVHESQQFQIGLNIQTKLIKFLVDIPFDFTQYIHNNPDYLLDPNPDLKYTTFLEKSLPELSQKFFKRGELYYNDTGELEHVQAQALEQKLYGNELARLQNFENAIKEYQMGLELTETYVLEGLEYDLTGNLAQMYINTGQHQLAIALLKILVKDQRFNPKVYYRLETANRGIGNFKMADKYERIYKVLLERKKNPGSKAQAEPQKKGLDLASLYNKENPEQQKFAKEKQEPVPMGPKEPNLTFQPASKIMKEQAQAKGKSKEQSLFDKDEGLDKNYMTKIFANAQKVREQETQKDFENLNIK